MFFGIHFQNRANRRELSAKSAGFALHSVARVFVGEVPRTDSGDTKPDSSRGTDARAEWTLLDTAYAVSQKVVPY